MNHGILYRGNQLPHANFGTLEVNHDIHNLLTGSMISDLPASIALDNWNVTGHQHMFGFPCLALSEDMLMLNQPDFIRSGVSTELSEIMHSLRYGAIGL